MGYRTASAVTTRSMAPRPAVSTVTGVGGSCSSSFAFSFPQPASIARTAARPAIEILGWSNMLQSPRQGLEIGQGDTITRQTVIIRIARLVHGVLRVDDFEGRGLARSIAEQCEPQALGGQVGGTAERIELRLRRLRFGV